MTLTFTEQLVHSAIRIECEDRLGNRSSGSGFFFKFCETGDVCIPCVVTNKHVVQGATRGLLHLTATNEAGKPQYGAVGKVRIDDFESRCITHPDASVDLAVFPFAGVVEEVRRTGKAPFFIQIDRSLIATRAKLAEMQAIEDIIMIGYPNGIWDSVNNTPIIRRGITATPVFLDYEGMPQFVIDAACFPGSSGSPVFLFNNAPYTDRNGTTTIGGTRFSLLGVLFAGPQHTATGEIVVAEVPTVARPVPISRIPNNLGICIKATKLLDFELLFVARGLAPAGFVPSAD